MENRLAIIKELHNEANEKAPSSNYDDMDRVNDILRELFHAEHTDWLIEQAEALQKISNSWKELAKQKRSQDIDNFFIVVEDILSDHEII